MKTYTVYLGLGSNQGDRQRYLQRAALQLSAMPTSKVVWASSVYETDPFGTIDQPKFLNAAIELETGLEPPALLEELKSIETRLGRSGTDRWGPREIDIDILMYEGLHYQDEHLTVPHPDMQNRKFVLIPLKEIAPDSVHPVNGMTVSELDAACRDGGRVFKTVHHIVL